MSKVQSALVRSGYKQRTRGISKRVQNVAVSAIKEMALLAMKEKDSISLSWGLPSFKTPEHIRKGVKEALDTMDYIGKYAPTHGVAELREIIAEDYERRFGVCIDPETQIIVHAGAMEGLTCAIQTLVDPGDEVIITDPGFSSHILQVKLAGGKVVYWPLNEEKDWDLNTEMLENLITNRTKALIIVNPANPTGSVFSKEQLQKVAEIVKKHNIMVISDEPYDFLVYDGKKHNSIAQFKEIKDNTIYIGSLSKRYAMTGWRIGYSIAEEGIRNQMLKVHDAIVICAPTISQVAAIIALKGPQDCVTRFYEEFKQRRKLIYRRLEEVDKMFSFKKTSGSYYVFPKIEVDHKDSYEFAIRMLKEIKVVMVPGGTFGPHGENHVRMTFCGSSEEINEAFDRLERWQAENC